MSRRIHAKRKTPMVKWTAKLEERLSELWLEGLSCSQIAETMKSGITRNSVIGKVHRLGLHEKRPRQPSAPKPARLPRRSVQQIAAAAALTKKLRNKAEPKFLPAPLPNASAWTPLPGTTPVSLLALADGVCRWPVGDDTRHLFCGCEAAPGASYCVHHKAMATKPAEPRSERKLLKMPAGGGWHRPNLRYVLEEA
jgi:GcrA cell cycle regulator